MTIEPGREVVVRDVRGRELRKRAVTGLVTAGDFPAVWVCSEREWEAAKAEGRSPDGIPWPATDVG